MPRLRKKLGRIRQDPLVVFRLRKFANLKRAVDQSQTLEERLKAGPLVFEALNPQGARKNYYLNKLTS